MIKDKWEGVYQVDRSSLLYLKEMQDGSFAYAVFDKQTRKKMAEGVISKDNVQDGLTFTRGYLAAARDAAIREAGLDGMEAARVALSSLRKFPASDIYRRAIWESDSLPKDDIRFIDSSYNELFRIPNGGRIEVEYSDQTFSAPCRFIDEYHTEISGTVYHICQFAEQLESGGGVCRPEPILEAEQAAWEIGWNRFLAVECSAGQWSYHLFDDKKMELKSRELEAEGCSVNEVRDMALAENKLDRRSMTPTDYGMLMDKIAARTEEIRGENRESVLGQLSTLKSGAKEHAAPVKKRDEVSL